MTAQKSILIVEDSIALVAMYKSYVEPLGADITAVETLAAARRAIAERVPEVLLLDLRLPDGDGVDLLKELSTEHPEVLVIVMTAYGSINAAVDAMREGAYDFIVKPFAAERVQTTVRNALEAKVLRTTVETFQTKIERPGMAQMVGKSLPMQAVYRAIQAVAPTNASVMITGETGTGKELCADAVHKASQRAKRNFVVLNCAAIPKDLLESELFGHLKGAFTGATGNRDGAAHLADGGTLFLDELGEMDIALQSKLLRFVQTGTFQRVGSSKMEKVDVRFVAATNRDPLDEVAAGRFREDLYYRLNVVPIEMPPLRERGDDILMIAEAFLARFAADDGKQVAGFDAGAKARLMSYNWPGNVRQLQNVVRNAIIFCNGDQLTEQDLPDRLMPRRAQEHSAVLSMVEARGAAQFDAPPPAADLSLERAAAFGSGLPPQIQPGQPQSQPQPQPQPGDLSPLGEMQTSAVAYDAEASATDGPTAPPFKLQPMADIERQMIDYALELYDGNVTKAAMALEISASSIYRKRSA